MHYFRKINRFILISLMLLGLSISSISQAATVNFIDETAMDFRISSITNLVIGEDLFNVTYLYNTNWDDAGFGLFFTNQPDATAAANAVSDLLNLSNIDKTDAASFTISLLTPFREVGDLINTSQTFDSGANPQEFSVNNFTLLTSKNFGDQVAFGEFSAVPVPAAVWLFGTALIGLIGFGKRKSRIAA